LPFVGEVRLWRVAVKPGCEETTTFVLMEKIIRGGPPWTIASIVGRVSRPGWIVIEAANPSDVQVVCRGVMNVFSEQIQVVEPEDGPACLKERISFTPQAHSWVRLKRYPYRGDLAYVRAIAGSKISVLVVPRLDLERHRSKPPAKRQRARSSRPDQGLLDVEKARTICGEKALTVRNQVIIFKRQIYQDGYLCLETDVFYPEEAIPTPEELVLFNRSSIPKDFLQRTLELMGSRRLCVGDPVKVIEGEAQGAVGTVTSIIGEAAVIRLSLDDLELALPTTVLRKYMRVGDTVVVVVGPLTGVTGLVTSIMGEMLVFYNHKTAEEVSPFRRLRKAVSHTSLGGNLSSLCQLLV
ncbi:hypothetical protein FPV67DRAFT_1414891, partial [Lyophyllum atratum]